MILRISLHIAAFLTLPHFGVAAEAPRSRNEKGARADANISLVISSAKVSVAIDDDQKREAYVKGEMELLLGETLALRAVDKTKQLHPDIARAPVEVRFDSKLSDPVMKISVISTQTEWCQKYLNALVDEYVNYRKEIKDRAKAEAMNTLIPKLLDRERQLKSVGVELERAKIQNASISEIQDLELGKLEAVKQYQTTRDAFYALEEAPIDDGLVSVLERASSPTLFKFRKRP